MRGVKVEREADFSKTSRSTGEKLALKPSLWLGSPDASCGSMQPRNSQKKVGAVMTNLLSV